MQPIDQNQAPELTGAWINQNGSTIEIDVSEDGTLAGFYCSGLGRAAAGKRYPLTGQQSGELVCFQVVWKGADKDLHAITSFSGRFVAGSEDTIHTVWVLARQFEDEALRKPTGAWNAFLTNADVFVRLKREG